MRFEQIDKGLSLHRDEDEFVIGYHRECDRRRALKLVLEFDAEPVGFTYYETPNFERLGIMLDCSRGGVLSINAFKHLCDKLSAMGYNEIQLYTEDTYTVEGYPYLGYLRGRYSADEFREMDSYANDCGIELVPCIQTLAHLEHALKWRPFSGMKDVNDIMLCGNEDVYEFLDAVFKSFSGCLKSRRINIGMDEAHMLGLGTYLEQNGYQNRPEIMLNHLKRVLEIAAKYDYEAMMWSDMFFRLAYDGEYYISDDAPAGKLPSDTLKIIEDKIKLVYWDYYSEDRATYKRMLKAHQSMGLPVIFAGRAWRWHGFSPGNEFSFHVGYPAAAEVVDFGIKEVFITSWGDNGNEGSIFNLLPTFQFWAETCYADNNRDAVARRFKTCTGADFDAFMALDKPQFTPDNPAPGICAAGAARVLFYQDILLGLLDVHVVSGTSGHFSKVAAELTALADKQGEYRYLFETQAAFCELLTHKVNAGVDITKAYISDDKDTLKKYAETLLPEMVIYLEKFQQCFRTQWQNDNKIFGLEVFDLRTGGLRERILAAKRTLEAYLNNEISSIPELEEKRLPFALPQNEAHPAVHVYWHQIVTPGGIAGI